MSITVVIQGVPPVSVGGRGELGGMRSWPVRLEVVRQTIDHQPIQVPCRV
jgi:hypothetical protein